MYYTDSCLITAKATSKVKYPSVLNGYLCKNLSQWCSGVQCWTSGDRGLIPADVPLSFKHNAIMTIVLSSTISDHFAVTTSVGKRKELQLQCTCRTKRMYP